jgi:hypothetical protein
MKGKPIWHNKNWIKSIPDLDKQHHVEIKKLAEFCDKIVEGPNSQYLKNYVLIRLSSIIEGYQKAIITTLVDNFEIKPSQVLDSNQLRIDLDQLEDFDVTNVTKGKLVTTALKATNPRSLHEFFTGINKVRNFFQWFDDLANEEIHQKDWWDFVSQTLDTRNDVIHNLADVKDTAEELHAKIHRMYDFASYSLYFSTINLCILNDKTAEAKEVCTSAKLRIKVDKFKSITDAHLINKAKKQNKDQKTIDHG